MRINPSVMYEIRSEKDIYVITNKRTNQGFGCWFDVIKAAHEMARTKDYHPNVKMKLVKHEG